MALDLGRIRNARRYIEGFLKIKAKDGRLVPLILNPPQQRLYTLIKGEHEAGRPVRIIILKARQMGFSTLTEALIFHKTATTHNTNSFIIAHENNATKNLYAMFRLFYDELPQAIKPMRKYSNTRELSFENPSGLEDIRRRAPGLRSRVKCATATEGVGRSDTIHNLHISEFAFWKGDKKGILNGVLSAVPPLVGTLAIIESTANGFDGFSQLWDMAVRGEFGFIPLFVAWHEMPEYRMGYDGFVLTEEELALQAAFGLDNEQIAWRRWCIKSSCLGDRDRFKQEFPASPEEAFIASGSCVFDTEKLSGRIHSLWRAAPPRRGDFSYTLLGNTISDIAFVESEQGAVAIYQEPQRGHPYVIGGDTAGDGSDYFSGQVINNHTGRQAATLWQKYDEDLYAQQLYCLGMYYNTALLAVEVNFSSHPNKVLQALEYPLLFKRYTVDSITTKMLKKFGVRTDKSTRPVMIGELVEVARDHSDWICDLNTLYEMTKFVKKDGKAQAENGANDDLVMGLAIAHYARSQQRYTIENLAVEGAGLPFALQASKGDKNEFY